MRYRHVESRFCTSILGEYAAMLIVAFAGMALLKWTFSHTVQTWETPFLACVVILVTVGQLPESTRLTTASLSLGCLGGLIVMLRLGANPAAAGSGWAEIGLRLLLAGTVVVGVLDITRQVRKETASGKVECSFVGNCNGTDASTDEA